MNEIRFNLDDIIVGELIDDILVSLSMVHEKTPIQKVHFWHNGIDQDTVREFHEQFTKVFGFTTTLVVTTRTPEFSFVWFDVLSDEVVKRIDCSNRFSYIYPMSKKSSMLLGIHNFYQVYNYIETHPKSRRILYDKHKEKQ